MSIKKAPLPGASTKVTEHDKYTPEGGGWQSRIPAHIWEHPDLSPLARLLYCALCKFRNSETYECYPSQATLGNITKLNRTTLTKTIRELEAFGMIVRTMSKPNPKINTLYYIPEPDNIIELSEADYYRDKKRRANVAHERVLIPKFGDQVEQGKNASNSGNLMPKFGDQVVTKFGDQVVPKFGDQVVPKFGAVTLNLNSPGNKTILTLSGKSKKTGLKPSSSSEPPEFVELSKDDEKRIESRRALLAEQARAILLTASGKRGEQ